MTNKPVSDPEQVSGLTIGDLAERTGVPQPTLRTWESRYGAPRPERLPGGHRRYSDEDVALVMRVLRHRATGLSVETAVARAAADAAEPVPSVFAGLRRRHARLSPQILSKRTLLALTRAVEDECCARAEHPVLFASFQRAEFYLQSRSRWRDLAQTAEHVVVFADFTDGAPPDDVVTQVHVPAEAPLRREWFLVCDAPDYPACVAGWELPGQEGVADADRRFETLWTVDPSAVRAAAQICAGLAASFDPLAVPDLGARVAGTAPRASDDLDLAVSLFNRVVGYVDAGGR